MDLLILSSFLGLDIMKSVVLSWSNANKEPLERPSDFNVIFLKDVISLIISAVYATVILRKSLLWTLQSSADLAFQHLPSAFIVVLSQNAAFTALQFLDIGTFKLLLQGCTPLTVVFSIVFLKQGFRKRQMYAILANVLFSILFYLFKNNGIPDSHASSFGRGIAYSLAVTMLSSLGGVVSERVLKTGSSSIIMQLFSSRLALVAASTIMYIPMRTLNDENGSFLQYFDSRTSVVILQYTASSFLTTIMITRLSTTAKAITQAASAAIAQIATMVSTEWMHNSVHAVAASNTNPIVTLCAIGILYSVYSFHTDSAPELSQEPQLGTDKI